MQLYHRTPLFKFSSGETLPNIYLKMECFQPSGSFKNRGIGQLCAQAKEDGFSQIISSSGGNAGLAAAYAARNLNLDATVVVPETTSQTAKTRIQKQGATVITHGANWNAAHQFCLEQAEQQSAYLVHPYDHPLIWEGHATLIDEIIEDGCIPDCIVLSVGGGGLLGGVLHGLSRNRVNNCSLITVETRGADCFAQSWEAGTPVTLDGIDSIATSLGALSVAPEVFSDALNHSIHPKVVSDLDACKAARAFVDDFRVLVEPACGASLSALYLHQEWLQQYQSVVVIVCGGVGVSYDQIASW